MELLSNTNKTFFCRDCNKTFEVTCNCSSFKCKYCNSTNIISNLGYNKLVVNNKSNCIGCKYFKPIAVVNYNEVIVCEYGISTNLTMILKCPINKWK